MCEGSSGKRGVAAIRVIGLDLRLYAGHLANCYINSALGVIYYGWKAFNGTDPWYTWDDLARLLEASLAEL